MNIRGGGIWCWVQVVIGALGMNRRGIASIGAVWINNEARSERLCLSRSNQHGGATHFTERININHFRFAGGIVGGTLVCLAATFNVNAATINVPPPNQNDSAVGIEFTQSGGATISNLEIDYGQQQIVCAVVKPVDSTSDVTFTSNPTNDFSITKASHPSYCSGAALAILSKTVSSGSGICDPTASIEANLSGNQIGTLTGAINLPTGDIAYNLPAFSGTCTYIPNPPAGCFQSYYLLDITGSQHSGIILAGLSASESLGSRQGAFGLHDCSGYWGPPPVFIEPLIVDLAHQRFAVPDLLSTPYWPGSECADLYPQTITIQDPQAGANQGCTLSQTNQLTMHAFPSSPTIFGRSDLAP